MKLQYKLFILLLVIILIIGFLSVISTSTILKRGLKHSLIAREKIGLEILESRIFPHLANRDYEKVTEILFEEKTIKKELIYYIAVYDKNGGFLAHTFLTDIPAEIKHRVQKNIKDFSTAELRLDSTSVIEMNVLIKEGAYEIGYLCIGYKKEYIENIISQIIRATISIIIILAILSTILSFFLSRYIVKPVKKLAEGMDEVSRGNLNYKIETISKDEIGKLANSFNKMTGDLQKVTVSKYYVDNIIRNMIDSLVVVAPNNRITMVNQTTLDLLGYREDELLDQPMEIIYEKDDRNTLSAGKFDFDVLISKEFISNVERIYLRKDGQKIPIIFSSAVMRDSSGRTEGLICAAVDITERKRAEEKIRDSEAKYHTLFESSSDAIMMLDEKGFFDCNNATLRIFGFSEKEDFLNIHPADVSPPYQPDGIDSLTAANNKIAGAFRKGTNLFEWIHRRKNGEDFPAEVLLTAFQFMGRQVLQATVRDITERKQAEESLNLTLKELSAKTAELGNAYESIEADRNNLLKALEYFYQSTSMIEKEKGFDTFSFEAEDNPYLQTCWEIKKCRYEACPVYGKPRQRCWQIAGTHCGGKVQGQFAQKIGNCHECEVYKNATSTPLLGIKETFNNMINILRIKHEELVSAKLSAEEANRLKSEFLANISHEIRTPINGILGMTSIALDTELTVEQRDYLRKVQKSGYALLAIINNILDFSKIESGRLELDTMDFNLRITVEDIADILNPVALEKNLELVCQVHHDVPCLLKGDAGRIRQILLNLGSNALKFTERGEVRINVELEKETEDKVFLLFSVSDTGIGIPENKQKIIFEPFVQADGSTSKLYGGTGLGLSISQRLINMMGSEIRLASKPGMGSRFWFTLKLEKQIIEELISEKVYEDVNRLKVLIVDENETSRAVLFRMLESFRCRPQSVSNCEAAVQALKNAARDGEAYRVVLLDMQMPGMDVVRITTTIKNMPELKNAAVIVLTSIGRQGDVIKLKDLGCDSYLVKPVKQSLLLDAIMTAVNRKTTGRYADMQAPVVTRFTIEEQKKQNVRIFVVEDNIINQQVVVTMLKKAGYINVDVAENGRHAVEAIDKTNYDIIFMDVQMPEIDGFEATRLIREKEKGGRHNIIVAMTAHALPGDRKRCMDAGMDDYIAKPINPNELFRVIQKWVKTATKKSTDMIQDGKALGPDLQALTSKTDQFEKQKDSPVDVRIAMERFDNDLAFYKKMISEFLKYIPEKMKGLEDAANAGDYDEILKYGHNIKGSASVLAADRITSVALDIENKGKLKDPADIFALIGQLKYELSRLEDFNLKLTS